MAEQTVFNLDFLVNSVQNQLIKTYEDAVFDMAGSKAAWLRYIQNYEVTEEVVRDILDNITNNLMQGFAVDSQFLAHLIVLHMDVDAVIFSGANTITMPSGEVIDVAAMRAAKKEFAGPANIDYTKFNK
jgi:hypothetical protein